MARVYIPNNLVVQFPATQENPGGRTVSLNQGWIDADDEMMRHPVIGRLVPQSAAEQKRADTIADAVEKRNQAINKANVEYAEAVAGVDQEVLEEQNAAAEDRTKRADEAARRGYSFNEAHPDPEAERARALTAGPAMHMAPAASLQQQPEVVVQAKDRLPTEEEASARGRARLADDDDDKRTSRAKTKD